MTLTFAVAGVPTPKGSTKAFYVPSLGRAVVTEDNARTRPWAALVRDAASEAIGVHGITGLYYVRGVPVRLDVTCVMPRPASLPKRVTQPTKKPDLDKLVRTIKDALTGIVWQDDSQVVEIVARKRFVTTGERPGAHIAVAPFEAITHLMPSHTTRIDALPLFQEVAHV